MSPPTAAAAGIPSGSWVLVTGVNGFIASHVALQLLDRGYKVRGTVRDLSTTAWLTEDLFAEQHAAGSFQLYEVPDFTQRHAFQSSVKGVGAIAHIASPNNFDPDPAKVIPPAVVSTMEILQEASSEPSVKQVVFTSTPYAAADMLLPGNAVHVEKNTWNLGLVEAANAPPPYLPSRGPIVYGASKLETEKAVWRFLEQEKPRFNINVMSSFVAFGPILHSKQSGNSTGWLKQVFYGDDSPTRLAYGFYSVHVRDVALLYVAALLDPEVNGARLQAWAEPASWNDVLRVLRKLYPDRQILADSATAFRCEFTTDTSECVWLLKKWGGQSGFKSLEESIRDALENVDENAGP